MKNILIITGLLPIKEIRHKRNENDILLVTEDNFNKEFPNVVFHYFYLVPDTNKLLAGISSKWKSYYSLKRNEIYSLRGRKISVFGVIKLPKNLSVRDWLYEFSFRYNKKRIKEVLDDFKPTLIHAQNTDSDAYLARRIQEEFRIPYIVTLRGLNRISDAVVKKNIDNAKALIALSPTQRDAGSKISKKNIHLIPHGIPEHFYNAQTINLQDDLIKFVSVSRLLKLKNLHLVIEALSKVEFPYIYDIYGDGPERINLERLIKQKRLDDKIQLHGNVENEILPGVLKKYDLFVMPSFPESLGRVYFEAMASGVPVVACRGTGVDGIVINEKEGFLVAPGSVESLLKVFEYVALNKQELSSMGAMAYDLALKYSWDNVLRKLYSLYSIK